MFENHGAKPPIEDIGEESTNTGLELHQGRWCQYIHILKFIATEIVSHQKQQLQIKLVTIFRAINMC